MNLLLRFYNINSGNIVIDGVELEKFEEQEIRKKIGLVLQDAFYLRKCKAKYSYV